MILVERHIVSRNHREFKTIDNLCFLSKNLYNSCLYTIRKHKEETGSWVRYNDLERKFSQELHTDFFKLPRACSQQILMLVDQSLKSYFALLNKWKYNPKSLTGCPQFPKYKHKTKGRNIVVFTSQQARFKKDKGIIQFPKKSGLKSLRTKIQGNLKQVRLIPQSSCYVIEVVYEMQEQKLVEDNNEFLTIDLGLNNLLTCFDTSSNTSFIVNGKPLKSMNQYYNKKKTKVQSSLKKNHNKHHSRKLDKLNLKRSNKIKDYLHKSSRSIVNYCLESNISNVAIGLNKDWKRNIELGKVNNQNFVQIPFALLIEQLRYKCELVGINFQTTEESYTSKCSFLDLESLEKQESYVGKRIKRGMFLSSEGLKINADLNGALNILRKVTPDKGQEIAQTLRSRGQVLWPLKIASS